MGKKPVAGMVGLVWVWCAVAGCDGCCRPKNNYNRPAGGNPAPVAWQNQPKSATGQAAAGSPGGPMAGSGAAGTGQPPGSGGTPLAAGGDPYARPGEFGGMPPAGPTPTPPAGLASGAGSGQFSPMQGSGLPGGPGGGIIPAGGTALPGGPPGTQNTNYSSWSPGNGAPLEIPGGRMPPDGGFGRSGTSLPPAPPTGGLSGGMGAPAGMGQPVDQGFPVSPPSSFRLGSRTQPPPENEVLATPPPAIPTMPPSGPLPPAPGPGPASLPSALTGSSAPLPPPPPSPGPGAPGSLGGNPLIPGS